MELDTENTNRSYLFGRLIAIAENIEYSATKNKGGSTSTNAERLFTQFTLRPGQTWFNLEKLLQPYFMKLYSQGSGGLVQFFKKSIQEIILKLGEEGLKSKKPLDEMFILGYYGQKSFGYKNENTTEMEGE